MGRTFIAVLLLGCATFATNAYATDDRSECARASDSGQDLRDNKHLVDAHQQFLECSRESCPATIRKDCMSWLQDTEANMPTVVLSVKDAQGQELTNATVSYDGHPLATHLDGSALQVDPGSHTFHFEVPNHPAFEQQIVIHEGQKDRLVPIVVPGNADATDKSRTETKPSKLPAYIVGGASIVAVGVGVVFWGIGLGERSTLENGCGVVPAGRTTGTCTDDQVSSSRTKLIVGDVLVGAGIVGLGAATYLFISESSHKTVGRALPHLPVTAFDVRPVSGGATFSLGGSF